MDALIAADMAISLCAWSAGSGPAGSMKSLPSWLIF